MAKREPKVKYTPETLRKAVDAYFSQCEEAGVCPDYAGLRVFLDISKDTIARFCNPDVYPEEHEEYGEIFARARDRRESWFTRRMSTEPRTASGCLAALKQADNGGWVDKTETSASVTISIAGYDVKTAGK